MTLKPSRPLLQVETMGEVSVVRFTCETMLDEETVRAVSEELYSLIRPGHQPKVLLDFAAVSRFNSAMLGTLIRLHKKVTTAGGQLALCGLNPDLYEVFTPQPNALNIYADERQALETF